MNEQNQQGQPQDNGAEAQAAPEQTAAQADLAAEQTAATQRLEATDAAQAATAAEPTAATQRLESAAAAESAAQQTPTDAGAGDAARPAAQPMVLPTGPTQRIEPQRVIEEAAQAAQQPIQAPAVAHPAAAAAGAPSAAAQGAQAYSAAAQQAAQPSAPQTQAYAPGYAQAAGQPSPAGQHSHTSQAAGQAAFGDPAAQASQGNQAEQAPSGSAWGQQAPYANAWNVAPQAAPDQQQSNPYAYPQAWGQAAKAPKAPMTPRKRKALRFGAAGAALALAVTLGAVPGWAFGHQAGIEQGQAQAEAQNTNPFGNSQNGNSQDGNGTNPFGGSQNGQNGQNGQGGDGSSGSNGSDGGSQYQQLPYGNYGNGSTDQGSTSSVEEGTKLDSGLAGLVMIDTTLSGGEGAGTGMILSSDGYVLTNYHVVEASTKVQVTDSTTGKTYTATVVGRDATHDVALLKLENASGLQTVKTASGSVSEGDAVHAVGNASGEGYLRKLSGSVTATQQSITTQSELTSQGEKLSNLIETDADVVPGYSGGALVNDAGEVVGMTTAASSGNTSATVDGYAIPISDALTIAEKIKNGESSDTIQIGRGAALGISVLSSDTGQVGGGYGVTVQEIIDGGAVAKSGLAANDTIIGLDGKTVKSYAALKEILSAHQPGDKVELTWLNSDGAQKSATVTLGESSVN